MVIPSEFCVMEEIVDGGNFWSGNEVVDDHFDIFNLKKIISCKDNVIEVYK